MKTYSRADLFKKTILFLLLSFFVFSISPNFTYAAKDSGGLVPCAGDSTYANRCTLCDLLVGIRDIVAWGKNILIILAILAIVIGAIMYIISAGDSGAMESAKNVIKQALWGVVIVLGAWLIVNTVLWLFAKKADLGIGVTNWYDFQCGSSATTGGDEIYPDTEVGGGTDDDTTPPSDGTDGCDAGESPSDDGMSCVPDTPPADDEDDDVEEPAPLDPDNMPFSSMSENEARAELSRLSGDKIKVAETSPGATKTTGLRKETVDGVVAFQKEVGTSVVINGGSEANPHKNNSIYSKSHANGYKVDINDTPAVNDYIERNYTPTGVRSDGAKLYQDSKGNEYARERTHWDVTYK